MSGVLSGALVKGMNSAGVICGAKHFILNEQETNRLGPFPGGNPPGVGSTLPGGDAYNVLIDDKSYHETYLAPFYDTVKHGIGGVMCSMNRINGTYGCENHETLSRHLKGELGFPGFVIPDAGAQKTSINSANAGLDCGDAMLWANTTLTAALTNGTFSEQRLDDMVIRNLIGYFRSKQDEDYPEHADYMDPVDVRGNHGALARKYAANSLALLKNTNNALPLVDKRAISIFGIHAAPWYLGPNTDLTILTGVPDTMNGHMSQIGGSAMSSGAFLVTPFQAMNERAEADGFMLKWWLNNTVVTTNPNTKTIPMLSGPGTVIQETTLGIASLSEACIVFINAWSGEGADRTELSNPESDHLVNSVADNCNNTIVVVNTVGPRLLSQWDQHENVTAILYGGPLGQYSGRAIADVLFGDINPAGKLVHTLAHNESDYDAGVHISNVSDIHFSEGNFIDYKYFDKYNKTPAYEFGFGLSYTTFAYGSNLTVSSDAKALEHTHANGALAVGGREDLWDIVATATASITNTGSLEGSEVAQLYVEFPAEADQPIRQLRGFQKVMLQPGATSKVEFELRRKDLSVWDVAAQEWMVVRGEYKMSVGASSRNFKAHSSIIV
jgi:beta-glucosidase